jgi:hypothetical protein
MEEVNNILIETMARKKETAAKCALEYKEQCIQMCREAAAKIQGEESQEPPGEDKQVLELIGSSFHIGDNPFDDHSEN